MSSRTMTATPPVAPTGSSHSPKPTASSPAVTIGTSASIIALSNHSGVSDSGNVTGDASAPSTIVTRPSRKWKLPNSIPTLVATKMPAVIGPDGRPLKKK